jgi:hypothetical protein
VPNGFNIRTAQRSHAFRRVPQSAVRNPSMDHSGRRRGVGKLVTRIKTEAQKCLDKIGKAKMKLSILFVVVVGAILVWRLRSVKPKRRI